MEYVYKKIRLFSKNYIITDLMYNIFCSATKYKFIFIVLVNSMLNTNLQATELQKFTISGFIKDSKSGEALIGATLFVHEIKSGTSTNVYGFYSFTLPKGNYKIRYSYIGFTSKEIQVELDKNIKINIEMSETSTILKDVVIYAESDNANVSSNRMGVKQIDVKQIRTIPILLGEQDILKTIQLLPGVQSAGEGNSGFYVRGGSSDQNLILLDEAPIYNASHLLGFFSVFNSDAIKNIELIKGGAPANYGGRLSSVLDIKMNEGNSKKYSVSGGVGLIASRLTIEGPIVKDKSSFIVSGRRTYADVFTKTFGNSDMKKIGLYFYDFNLKTNYKINEKNRIYLSGYFGRDVFNFNNRFGFNWGNKTATFRWNHLFSDKLFLNSSLIYSDYDYLIGMEIGSNRLDIKSGIQNFNAKEDFQYFINPKNSLKFGLNFIHHTFYPGELSFGDVGFTNSKILEKRKALESGTYLLHETEIGSNIKLNYGIRYSNFNLLGPGNFYKFNSDGVAIDTSVYKSGEIAKQWQGWEPRIISTYILNEFSSIKMAYSRNYQYLHLLSKSTSSSPTDLWVPSSNIVKPQYSDQVSIGYFRNFKNNMFAYSTEIYYKDMQNQIDYKNGADITLNELVESQLVFGKGRAYGIEFSLEKKTGNFTGWISYTLSSTERKFDAINNGKWFSARQDRTHDISIVGTYKLNDKLTFSASWVYYTGEAVTFPAGKYQIEGKTINYFTSRNGSRMPDYHRLDLGLTYVNKKTEKFESSWNFSIYNAYMQKNAYSISFRENPDNPLNTEAVRLSLFSIVPSVTYNFKF